VSDGEPAPAAAPPAGLCESCRHARRIASARSTFLRCGRADEDPRFAKYPRLPVVVCPGHDPEAPAAVPLPGAPRG
jgi:hypothetical protein